MRAAESMFNQAYVAFKVLGVATCAALSASALTTWVSMSALTALEGAGAALAGKDGEQVEADVEDDDEPVAASAVGPAKFDGAARVEGIARRNPFCPACAKAEPKPSEARAPLVADAGAPSSADLAGARPCTLPLRLVATMEAGLSSWATIRDAETGGVGPFGPEEFVRPGVPLVSVERTRVYLRNQGALEVLELGVEPPPPQAVKPAPAKVKEPEKASASRGLPGQAEAIKCDSEHACTISREFVDSLFGNPAKLMSQARVAPSVRDGETRGFEFRGVKKDSLPQALGLTNGDIVTSVNGNSLQSIDQVMGLVTKLRRASNLSITIERKGVTVNKEFEIR